MIVLYGIREPTEIKVAAIISFAKVAKFFILNCGEINFSCREQNGIAGYYFASVVDFSTYLY